MQSSRLRTLVYIDAENLSKEEIMQQLGKIRENKQLNLAVLKAYGSSKCLGVKLTTCIAEGADYVDTSLIANTRKNLADMKIIVDCLSDVFQIDGVECVYLLTKDNDFQPLVGKLKSFGVQVYSMIKETPEMKESIGLLNNHFRSNGIFPLEACYAIGEIYPFLVEKAKDNFSEEVVQAYLKYRVVTFAKKCRKDGNELAASLIEELDVKKLSFDYFYENVSVAGLDDKISAANLYTYQMFGVAANVQLIA